MDCKHSRVLDPSEYETLGLCEGITVRKHLASHLEEVGSLDAQADWTKFIGPVSNFNGGLSPVHSFMSISLPECLPERFEIVCYANEFAFLHDDVTDIADQAKEAQENDEMLEAFQEGIYNGTIEAAESGKRQLQAKILRTMMSLDRERAHMATKAWSTFLEQGSGRENHNHFKTLEEYLPYRSKDSGHMFWHALAVFGCAITVPENEMAAVTELVMPASLACSLVNDLLSFAKEYEAAQEAGQTEICNALWVLMGEHDCSLAEAKAMCTKRIKEEVAEYLRNAEDAKTRTDLSEDSKKYVEIMQYTISGNAVWSICSPRYNRATGSAINENERLRLDGSKSKFKVDTPKEHDVNKNTVKPLKVDAGVETNGHSKTIGNGGIRGVAPNDAHTNGTQTNGVHTNGVYKNGIHTDSFKTNGISTHSHEPNGINGYAVYANGHGEKNGIKINGNTNGISTNGFKLNEHITNGHNKNGSQTNGPDKVKATTIYISSDSEMSDASSLEPEEAAVAVFPGLKTDVVTEPYRYLSSLPSKGVRDMTINGLNFWLKVSADSMASIKSAVKMLHGSSLMLDDIEDGSTLRRGKPATHAVYGQAQTINSATFQYINATQEVRKLRSPHAVDIFIDEVQQLFVGQSYDLLWTCQMASPTVPEYLQMIDGKTGGLFRLLTRLMVAESPYAEQADFTRMCSLFGRYFQIRDDYQNLTSLDYASQKGFCEDLDEGKYSLPLVLALNNSTRKSELKGLLMQRRVTGALSFEQKTLVLEHIRNSGALDATLRVMDSLYDELEGELDRLGSCFGAENHELQLILDMLKV